MKYTIFSLLALFSFSIIAGVAQSEENSGKVDPKNDYVILKIGDNEVMYSEVETMWKNMFPSDSAPEFTSFDETIQQNVLRGIVSERLIYNQALEKGVDKRKDLQKRMENMRKQLIMQVYLEEKAQDVVTEAALKKAYDDKIKSMKGNKEVRARHILVESEEEVKAIKDSLDNGADFAELAKEKSTDKASGVRGGDLGYFTKDKMVKEFADTAFALEKNAISDPVKSPFGWHIIKAVDKRDVEVPSFAEMKESLNNELTGNAMQHYIESLVKDANVVYYDAEGNTLPFSFAPEPAE